MRYLIVDLEATCWERNKDTTRMETIEIGALLLDESLTLPAPEFQRFVRPQIHPELSAFCTALTSITQADVDAAATFEVVFPEFVAWARPDDSPITFCSWGSYDYKQLKLDCWRRGVPFPEAFETRLNLKHLFRQKYPRAHGGMAGALTVLGLTLEGTHHRGIDDARNIARIAQTLLVSTPRTES